jgi:photosystem II stability/assembly factor-like uncharacterized protein
MHDDDPLSSFDSSPLRAGHLDAAGPPGGGALFETTDGGASWVQRDVPSNLADPLNGIYFLDSRNGWTFSNVNSRTTNGGTTWTEIPFLGSTYFMKFYTRASASRPGTSAGP